MRAMIFLVVGWLSACGVWAAELEEFQEYMRAQEELAERQLREGKAQLRDLYVASISNRIGDATAAGDLRRVLLLRETVERMTREGAGPLPEELVAEEGFARMQETWERLDADLRRRHAEKMLGVFRAYDQALEQLQVSLTRENEIEKALAVQGERRRVAEDPRVGEWRAWVEEAGVVEEPVPAAGGALPVLAAFNASMVLYLPFDQDERGAVRDRSRARNDGEGRNVGWGKDGPRGGHAVFNGRDAEVVIPNAKSLQVTGDLTIAFWMRPDALEARRNPLNKSYGGEYTLTLEADGRVNFYHGIAGRDANPYQGFTLDRALPRGEWSHVAVVRDLTNRKLIWYVNGRAVGDVEAQYKAAVGSEAPLRIGRGYAGAFAGGLDEVMILTQALGPNDVMRIYRSTGGR